MSECERCGRPRLSGYLVCRKCHDDWIKLDDESNGELYEIFITNKPKVFIFR